MSKKSAHTPGPWIATDIGTIEDDSHNQEQIAAVNPCHRKANARLIAAAPDLLKALELFVEMWNSGDSTRMSKRAQQKRAEMWDEVNAAIAKARGTS